MNWDELGLTEQFASYFKQENFDTPSKVQVKIVPELRDRESLLVVAQTGTGKTLSYVLPLVEAVKDIEEKNGVNNRSATPIAIILAPTKELAQQIHLVLKSVSHHVKMRSRLLTGGMSSEKLSSTMRQSFEVLVGTP